jgi:hypothetical protein
MALTTDCCLPCLRDRGRHQTSRARLPARSARLFAVKLFVACALTTEAHAQSRAAVAAALARAGDAVITVVAYRDGTTDVTSGTGVRVSDGRVVTALRHLRGASRVELFAANGDLLATTSTLEQADPKLDLGVFARITALGGERIALSRRSVTVTQKVNVLGPRKGAARVVAERTITHVEPDDAGRALMRLGAPVTTSAAGSPVVNVRNELVGIALGSLANRTEADLAIDVSAVRELLARAPGRFSLPARDGTVAGAADQSASSTRPPDPVPVRGRTSIFPERYGAPIAGDTVGSIGVELFGCARLEARQKVYCYLRFTNLSKAATLTVNGGDLADSTNRKRGEAENLVTGEQSQRVAGWRAKAEIALKELEAVRVALEFAPPARESEIGKLMLDIAGERTLWLGPLVVQRVP